MPRFPVLPALLGLLSPAMVLAQPVPDGKLSPDWITAGVPDGFSVTAVGDLILSQPIAAKLKRSAPDLAALLRSSDVTFGNFEGTSFDLRSFGGFPEATSGGGWLLSMPEVPSDLKSLGFSMVSRANNHSTDWGVKGMQATDKLLDEAGLTHAGTGQNLSEARSAAMLLGPSARVSLVAMASRFEPNAMAADPLGRVPGRPGLNGLRTTRYTLVSPARLAQLAQIRDAQPAGSVRATVLDRDTKTGTVTLFGAKYRASETVGDGMAFSFTMNDRDRTAILRSIRQGKQTSDFAIATIHAHEPGNYADAPPDFLPVLAHQAIDNGADMFIGHGPHQLRGIEVYKGKPIFYSLGNFFFTYNALQPVTRDEFEGSQSDPEAQTEAEYLENQRVTGVFKDSVWFESVVARSRFDGTGKVAEILLYPVELHWSGERDADRGIPRIAPADVGARILARLQKLSAPYGTTIAIRRGVGVITP